MIQKYKKSKTKSYQSLNQRNHRKNQPSGQSSSSSFSNIAKNFHTKNFENLGGTQQIISLKFENENSDQHLSMRQQPIQYFQENKVKPYKPKNGVKYQK